MRCGCRSATAPKSGCPEAHLKVERCPDRLVGHMTASPQLRARKASLRPGTLMRRLADQSKTGSFSNMRRSRRFEAFAELVDGLLQDRSAPLRILDIGGTNSFWEQRGWGDREDVEIVLINLEAEPRRHPSIESRAGDATDLSEFPDGSFDVVFSNS